MRDGIAKCTSQKIHILPGSSPPLPTALAWVSKSPYTSSFKDYYNSFYSCTEFRITEPQEFVIQWQGEPGGKGGMGIAWIDEDKDNIADKAFGFSATLPERDKPEFGPIGPVDKTKRIYLVK